MIEFDAPIDSYKSYFSDAHQKLVVETFDDLLRQSGVNEEENVQTVAALRG